MKAFGIIALTVFIILQSCSNRTASSLSISFYKVPLICGAAPEIGCGSRIKPFFLTTEKEGKIKEAWANRQGTVIAIVWAEDFNDEKQREDLIQPLFRQNNIDAELIDAGEEANRLLISFKKDKWYKGMDIDLLSLEEAGVIANEMVMVGKENSILSDGQADSIRPEIENYFKGELVKVRTLAELGSNETRDRWRSDVANIVSKYIGQERTAFFSETYLKYREEKEKTQVSCCKEEKDDCSKKPVTSETSLITCPKCGHRKEEKLPTEVCQLSYTCEKCKTIMHPDKGDCCVFCTYGDHKCPSMQ